MDYFKILGVSPNASPEAIKQAYRKKARQYHPDVNPAPDAEKRFQEIAEAYRVLSDDKSRQAYLLTLIKQRRLIRQKTRIQRPSSATQTLHFGFLAVGIIMLAIFVDRAYPEIGFALLAESTTCTVESTLTPLDTTPNPIGDAATDAQLNLAVNLPESENHLQAAVTIPANQVGDYQQGDRLTCQHSRFTGETRLGERDIPRALGMFPLLGLALVLMWRSLSFFWRTF